VAEQDAEKLGFRVQPLKGLEFEELMASLKRCPDTKLVFFSKLQSRFRLWAFAAPFGPFRAGSEVVPFL
jgi:hypothetical protein